MVVNQLWFALPVAVVVVIAALLALLGWRRWLMPGAPAFMAIMLTVVVWGIGYCVEIVAPTVAQKLLWAKFQYIGIVTLPIAWLIFAYQVSEAPLHNPWRAITLLKIIPIITLALVWTNELHGLMYARVALDTTGPFVALDATYGPWFWVHSVYSYSIMGLGSIVLARHGLRAPRLYRMQVGALLVGIVAPWIANVLYLLDLGPIPNLDITVFAFAFTGALFAYSLLRYRLLDLRPVARDALIEGMRDGVLVVDAQQRIVDLNPAARRILENVQREIIGRPINGVLPVHPEELFDPERCSSKVTHITLNHETEQRHYDLTVSPIRSRNRRAGHVLVLHDNTQRIQAETALRESEARYRAVSEMTSDYTFAIQVLPDGQLHLEWVTHAFTTTTGYTVEELIAAGDWEMLIHPADLPIARQFLHDLLQGKTTTADARVISRDGTVRWMRSYGQPEWDAEHNKIVRFLAASRDITARTEAVLALQESELRYRLLFESSPHPMWVYDQQTLCFLAVNSAAIEHYGYTRDEFLHMTILDIRPAEDVTVLQHHLAQPTPQSSGRSEVWRHITKDGRVIDVEITSHPIVFDGRRGKVVTAQDITVRRQTDLALRQQNEYLAALHETTLSIIQRFDVSDVLEAIVVRAGVLVGTAHGYIYLVNRDPDTGHEVLVVEIGVGIFRAHKGFKLERGEGMGGKVWETGEPLVVANYDTWPGRSPNFQYGSYSSTTGVPLTSKDRVVGVIGLAHVEPGNVFSPSAVEILQRFAQLASLALDNARLFTTAQAEIAVRKHAEEELALARDQALEAARLKSEFLAIMSHELRTPLNAIIGFTELMQQQAIGPLNRDQQRSLERVVRNSMHLRDMINDMLDLNKLDAGGMRLLHEPLWLPEVVESAAHSVEMIAANKQLQLVIEPTPPGIPLLYGDAGRLRQIVLNLLSNAVKFTPEQGRVTVQIEHGAPAYFRAAAPPPTGLPDGQWVALSVQDTGIGIAPAEHDRIWHEFYQGDASTTRQYGGTGLGLAIVRRLTTHMNCQIGLRSSAGNGATFTIWLPVTANAPIMRSATAPPEPQMQRAHGRSAVDRAAHG